MQLRRVGLLNHPAYYGRSHPLNRRYRGLVDETFSLQGGQLLAAARLLNKTRQVFAMSAIKSFETPYRLEDLEFWVCKKRIKRLLGDKFILFVKRLSQRFYWNTSP